MKIKRCMAALLAVLIFCGSLAGSAFAASPDTATLTGVWNFNDSLVDSHYFWNPEVGTVREFSFQSFAVYDGELRPMQFSSMEFTGTVLYYRTDVSGDSYSYTVWTAADGWLSDSYKQVFFYRSSVPGGYAVWLAENASQPVSNVPISGLWQFKPYSEFDALKPDNKFIYQEVEFWQSKTFETAYAISFRPYFDPYSSYEHYFVDGHNSDGSYRVGLADSGWWGEFERFRLVDFGSTPQLVSQDFYDLMTTCADPVNRSDFYPTVSGEWTWNNTLPDFQTDFVFLQSLPVTVNGVTYGGAFVAPAGSFSPEFGVAVLLFDDLYSDSCVFTAAYLEGIGWLDGSLSYPADADLSSIDLSRLVPGTQMQTWDFGTGSEQPIDFVNYMTANATQPGAEPATVTIPAGTYRFNDVIDLSYAQSEEDFESINFTVSLTYGGQSYIGYCSGIRNAFLSLAFYVEEIVPLYISETWVAVCTSNGWGVDIFGEDLQTITLPTDQEVSTEFYEWFTANVKPVTDDGGDDPVDPDPGETTDPDPGETNNPGGDDSGNTGGGDTGNSGSGGDNSGSGSGSDTSTDDSSHVTIIEWLQKIWQAIVDGFESVLTKLEELLGLSSGSPSEDALKDASSDVVDTVTDLFYGDDTDTGSSNTGSGGSGSSSGSGSSKVKKDDVKELSNISGRVKSWFSFDVDIGELFDIVEGDSDWYSQETANGIDSTVSVTTYGRDSDPYSMQDYYDYIDYLFGRYGGDAE